MKYFYDTEFLEDGKTIELISIGIVDQYGREYYAINDDMPYERIVEDPWLMDNVIAHLGHGRKIPKTQIRDEVRDFILGDPNSDELPAVELWADYAAYDHVVLAQLFGKMIDLPEGIPMYTNDFQQLLRDRESTELPAQESGLHNALADARHLKVQFDALSKGQQ